MGKKIKKQINLNNLPRKNNSIDWKNSIGYECDFIYDDVKGKIKIINYKNNYITFILNEKEYFMQTSVFKDCKFGKILCKISDEFKYKIGYAFKDDKRDMILIDNEYRVEFYKNKKQNRKWYRYKCNVCGWDEGWIRESDIIKNVGCSCCSGATVVRGINDIATTDAWMVGYFVNKEDAYNYTAQSKHKISAICPECKETKEIKLNTLYHQGLSCICSDGNSYPNKFMYNILNQLNIKFIREYSPEWAKGRRYDFYIPSLNLIIEMDGDYGHNSLDEIRIDNWKDIQAENYNIKVIRIDCKYPHVKHRFDYIKNNIINSKLINYFNFNEIIWSGADIFATKNLIKEICEYYNINKNIMLMKNIADNFNINHHTLITYLKRGDELGWCNYKKHNKKKVLVVELNEIFESCTKCSNVLTKRYNKVFSNTSISLVCNNHKTSYNNFTFKFID